MVFWHSRLSSYLQHWHPIRQHQFKSWLVLSQSSSLLMHLENQQRWLSIWSPAKMWKTHMEFWALGSTCSVPTVISFREWTNIKKGLCFFPDHSVFQINIFKSYKAKTKPMHISKWNLQSRKWPATLFYSSTGHNT